MTKKHFAVIALTITSIVSAFAGIQQKDIKSDTTTQNDNRFQFKLYGFVRNDFTYDSRKTLASVGELFNFIPYDKKNNTNGQDLNAVPSTRWLSVASRLGFDIASPQYGNFRFTAKIEADFCGSGTVMPVFRLRQANVALNWQHHQIIAGQTWHPMTGDMLPNIVSLNTGAPFNPFSRAPLIRYNAFINSNITISAAAIYQLQYSSPGPAGNSTKYQVFGGLPEFYIGATAKGKGWKTGIGAEYMAIRPFETYNDQLINTMAHSFSGQIFAEYTGSGFEAKIKSVLGQNLGHLLMMSGYGAYGMKNNDPNTIRFSPLTQSSSWVTLAYKTNNKTNNIRATLFGGYMKNLGASQQLIPDMVYVRGFENIDQMFRISPSVQYSYKGLNIGLEYEYTGVFYGDIKPDYSVLPTHLIGNHRAYLIFVYNFSHLFK